MENVSTQKQKEILDPIPICSDFLQFVEGVHLQSEFSQFVIWFATPRGLREVETQKEFAESIGVSQDTLTDWKKRHEFRMLVMQAVKEWMFERIPDVIDGLYEKTVGKGTAKEVEMFLRLAGMDLKNDKKKKVLKS